MFRVSPPRTVVGIQAVTNLAMGVQWLVLSNAHSTLFPFADLTRIGGAIIPAHSMWLWAFLFLAVAAVQLLGLALRRARISGVGALLAAPLLAFYGVCNGLSQAISPNGVFTVLILMVGLALWNATTSVMLLGRSNEWG